MPQHTQHISITILVTGGAGFIGSHTVLELLHAGFNVISLDNFLNSDASVIARIQTLARKSLDQGLSFKHFEIDVRDEAKLNLIFQDTEIAGVIHFAGLKAVAESFERPLEYWSTNLGGTLTLTRVMQRFGVAHLVFSSSALVYGLPKVIPIDERSELSAVNPYGRTKLVCEQFLGDIGLANPSFNVALLRYFNPVGAHPSGLLGESPRGSPNNLMPLVCQVASGRRPQLFIFGDDYDTPDGTCIRDYLHVMDLAEGHVLTLKSMMGLLELPPLKGVSVLNFGTGRGVSVKELVTGFEVANALQVPHAITSRRDGDVPILVADVQKAFSSLGWKAKRDLNAMCQDAWRWERQSRATVKEEKI